MLDLEGIKGRLAELRARGFGWNCHSFDLADVAALVAEVERLRVLLCSARGGLRTASETDEGWCQQRVIVVEAINEALGTK